MRPLCTLGLALWPDTPHQDVTAVTLCRQLARIATGGSDGSIWLWQGPSYWHPLAKSRVPPQQPPGTNNASQEPAEERIRPLALLLGQHENAITSMTCSYDGTSPVLVSADSAGTLCVWRLEDGVCLRASKSCLTWAPSTIVNVSCKGKPLIACAGSSAEIEVVDILGMKRVVRLFGHGEWCIDLCARNMDSVLEEELGSKAEPTVYSIDRGGTLCCWLADRSCTHAVIGWTPTVQVSEVPISFPRSLSLDPLSSALLVVGLGGSVLYKIGADHRLDGKQGAHLVVDINDRAPEDDSVHKLRLGLPHQASEGGTDPPEQRRRRRHASRAFIPKNAIRQWSSAPPEDFGEALAAQEAGETARLTQSTDTDDDAASARSGTGTAKGWLKAKGSLSPGGDRAVVWVDGVGMYAVSFAGGRGGELLGVDSGATDLVVVGGDSGGWLLGVTAEGKLHVWRPVSASKAPAGDMGGAAALKLRARQAAGLEGDASPCSPAGEPAKSRDRGPEGLHELLERDWVYEQGATLSDGFSWAASSRAARGETTTTVTAALVQIEAARPLRWFLGDRSGGVKVMSLPSGRELHALGGEGVAVRSMLCVPGSDTLLVGSDDGVVAAWHVGEQRRMYAFRQHVGAVRRLVWLGAQLKATMRHGNVFCSIGADRHVMVATTQSTDSNGDPGGPAVLYLLGGHSSEIKEVMWAERLGCVCVVTGDGGAHLWQLRDRGGADCIRRVAPALVPAVLSALQRSSGGGPVLHSEAACAEPEDGGEGEDVAGVLLGDEDGGGGQVAPVTAWNVGGRAGGVVSVLRMRCDVVAAAGAAAAGLQPPPAETPSPISSRVPSGLSSASRAPSGLSEKSRAPSELSSGLSEKSLASTEEAGLFGAAEDGKATVKEKLWARLGGEGALLAVALSAAMSGFAQPRALTLSDPVPGHSSVTASAYSVRVRDALAALGAPVMLQDVEAPLHASLAMVGGGGGITLLVPRVSWGCAACGVSPAVTGAITASAAVVVDACRAVAVSSKVEGVELCGALLHFLSKEAPSRLEPYLDSDVIALAHFWLVSPESARATAHALLSARLGRTQPATRQAIVTEWTAKLNERAAVVGPAPAGLAGPEGPAVIVLAVIGSHFVDSLNTATAARVAKALVAALSSAILLHSKAASHLLARGAALWCRHLTDPLALLRTLYTRYWRWQDFGTTMQEAEFALRSVAPILPSEFVEVIGEEASRHSQLVCHVRSERSVTAIRVLVAMIKRHPLPMLPALPRAVEVVLSTLDPAHPLVRQALMQHSTAALKEIVRRFPQATFHQETQRFAVGTVDALVVIFDVRTATKWRVLEGHEGAISAVTFDGAGQRLATFSAAEGRVRFWETGHSGPFGLFSSKVGRCVQQFTVPHAELRVADKAGAALAFGILFTPNAIVLTRDSVPICEFPIK